MTNPYYSDVAEKTDVRPLLADIEVPVFLAGAWQDEQTGGHFANMLDGFTGTDHFYASLTNGLHTESLSAGIAPRWLEFLDLYVAKRVPSLDTLRTIAPVLGEAIWETDQITLRDDRFAGATYDEALATFEADAPVEVHVRRGRRRAVPLAPMPAWSRSFRRGRSRAPWRRTWYLGPDGSLGSSTVGRTSVDVVRRRSGERARGLLRRGRPAATSGRSTPSSTGSPSRRARRPASCPIRSRATRS